MIAVRSTVLTEFTDPTFLTECRAVGTVVPTVITNRRTVTAVMAILTHRIGTVKTDTAVGTVFVHTVSTFAAVRTTAFRAAAADDTAFFTEIGTVTAQKTVFTQKFIRTMDTKIAGSAECITAVGAHFLTFRTEIHAVFAAFAARANNSAIGADTAVDAEAVGVCAVHADTTFRTQFILGAVSAFFAAVGTNFGTVRATAAANADHIHTVIAQTACGTEILFTDTITANAAVHAKLLLCTLGASFGTFRADISAVGASLTANANRICTVFTDAAVYTIIAIPADTVKTDAAFRAYLIVCTVHTLFIAIRTKLGTLRTSFTAGGANRVHTIFAFIAGNTVISVAADTVKTDAAIFTNTAISAVFTLFTAFFADKRTFRASVTAIADRINTIFADTAIGAIVTLTAHAVKANTALTAQFIICTICTFFAAFGTDVIGTFRTALAADTDIGHAVFALVAVIAVIPLTADTVVTDPAGTADPVRTVFALLIAFRTDQRTL